MIYLVAETWILLESNLVEKLKIIYRGRYKMEEISFQEYTKAQDKLFWYERFMEINDNSDECYFDLNIDWKERYELLSNKWTGWLLTLTWLHNKHKKTDIESVFN